MSLFIKQIAEKLAGQVAISCPDCKGGWVEIVGFLAEHPSIRMGNKWDSLISDLGTINEFTQLAQWGASSWISTSKMAWKGTDPIMVTLDFYLLTYLKSQVDGTGNDGAAPISKQAQYLAQLAAISEDPDASGALAGLKVQVHGGYKPNYFEDNQGVFNHGNLGALLNSSERNSSNSYREIDDSKGTCSIVINGNGMNTIILENMLLENLEMTPSTVRAGYWQGITNKGISQQAVFRGSAEPLYIKVNAGFKLARAATVQDVARMFGGSYSG